MLSTSLSLASFILLSSMDRQGASTPGWGSVADSVWSNHGSAGYDNAQAGYDNSSWQQQPSEYQQTPPAATPSPEANAIWHLLIEMRQESIAARVSQDNAQAAVTKVLGDVASSLANLTHTIASLNRDLHAPPAQPYAVPPVAPAPVPAPIPPVATAVYTSGDRPMKAKEPRMFNGATSEVEPFIDEVETNIRLQRMTNDLDKTSYLSTYLKDGNPKTWYYGIKTLNMSLLSDYSAFIAAFRLQFADPNYSRTALRKIKALRQTGSCASYAARFRELLPHVEFSDQTKLDQFKEGLKASVRDAVITVRPKPTNFDAYVDLVIDIDNELHENELNAREHAQNLRSTASSSRSHRPVASTPQVSSTSSVAPSSEVVPMEVDAVKFRGPLTQDEKDRRRRNNLCMYCGGTGHNADTCPNKSAKAKKRDAARPAAPASTGKA